MPLFPDETRLLLLPLVPEEYRDEDWSALTRVLAVEVEVEVDAVPCVAVSGLLRTVRILDVSLVVVDVAFEETLSRVRDVVSETLLFVFLPEAVAPLTLDEPTVDDVPSELLSLESFLPEAKLPLELFLPPAP